MNPKDPREADQLFKCMLYKLFAKSMARPEKFDKLETMQGTFNPN